MQTNNRISRTTNLWVSDSCQSSVGKAHWKRGEPAMSLVTPGERGADVWYDLTWTKGKQRRGWSRPCSPVVYIKTQTTTHTIRKSSQVVVWEKGFYYWTCSICSPLITKSKQVLQTRISKQKRSANKTLSFLERLFQNQRHHQGAWTKTWICLEKE